MPRWAFRTFRVRDPYSIMIFCLYMPARRIVAALIAAAQVVAAFPAEARVVTVNPEFSRIWGVSGEEVNGRPLEQVLPSDLMESGGIREVLTRTAEGGSVAPSIARVVEGERGLRAFDVRAGHAKDLQVLGARGPYGEIAGSKRHPGSL